MPFFAPGLTIVVSWKLVMNEKVHAAVRSSLALLRQKVPLVLGFSGGVDSTLLAEALYREGVGERLRLVHVDHGLHPDSGRWAAFCADFAGLRKLPFSAVRVSVPDDGNLEERARECRRQALLEQVPEGGVLMLAHHADDQAETLLLRLMRGAGVSGLSGMASRQPWQGREILRPLLGVTREEILRQARDWGLDWIEDPANRDEALDRNHVRHRILPLLEQRWPAAVRRLAAVAGEMTEAGMLLEERGVEDFHACGGIAESLALAPFAELSMPRRLNLLLWWLRRRGLRSPGRRRLEQLDRQVRTAAADRQPRLDWPEGCFVRFRGRLYLLDPATLKERPEDRLWTPGVEPEVPFAVGHLRVGESACPGGYALCLPGTTTVLRVVTARGGEKLRMRGVNRRLTELWREQGVPPWRRAQLPLFYHDGELLAAAGAGVADSWRADSGDAVEVCWRPQ